MTKNTRIAPSVLAADYTRLGQEIIAADTAGADLFHLDIMDGHFVPNISYGADIVKALRPHTTKYFDVHLMLSEPLKYIKAFKKAGANGITIHAEVIDDFKTAIEQIKSLDVQVGIAINPDTPVSVVPVDIIPLIDRFLIMTVHPGFGGQKFIPLTDKIEAVAALKNQYNPQMDVQIDGGVNLETAPLCINAGATTLVAGSAIFKTNDYATAIKALRG